MIEVSGERRHTDLDVHTDVDTSGRSEPGGLCGVAAVHGQVFSAAQLFTTSESDGDTITQYDFWNTGTGGGRFLVGGVTQGTNQDIYVPAAQLGRAPVLRLPVGCLRLRPA